MIEMNDDQRMLRLNLEMKGLDGDSNKMESNQVYHRATIRAIIILRTDVVCTGGRVLRRVSTP